MKTTGRQLEMLPRGGDRRLSELQGQVELTDTPPTKELKLTKPGKPRRFAG